MNAVQSLLYLLVCIMGFGTLKKSTEKPDDAAAVRADLLLLPVLFILGGMTFHLFWEADGRYIIRYYNFMFPLAACGLEKLLSLSLKKQSS